MSLILDSSQLLLSWDVFYNTIEHIVDVTYHDVCKYYDFVKLNKGFMTSLGTITVEQTVKTYTIERQNHSDIFEFQYNETTIEALIGPSILSCE